MKTPNKEPPPLFKHQQELFDKTCDEIAWAYFLEQGLGKTAPAIRTIEHLYGVEKLEAVVIVAPNGVHRNWISDELPKHSALPWRGFDWHSDRAKAQDKALERLLAPTPGRRTELAYFAITYDAILTPRGRNAVLAFKDRFKKFMLVIDEASKVRNPEALRTKKVAALRAFAEYVRLLNGTPIGNSALDAYAQMRLLDDKFWIRHGIGSFVAFRSRFAIMKKIPIGGEDDRPVRGAHEPIVPHHASPEDVAAYEQLDFDLGDILTAEEQQAIAPAPSQPSFGEEPKKKSIGRTIEVVVGFRELDKLKEMIAPISTRLTKEDSGVQLPPKLYSRILFDLPTDQRRAYDQLRKEYMLELESGTLITAPIALVRILKLQQIACGYIPNPDDPENPKLFNNDDGKNARLQLLLERLEDTPHQAIIWCRFNHDVDIITRALGPPKCVRYDGQVSQKDRDAGIDRFKADKAKFCVAKAASMGMGHSLPMAKSVFYYSNDFSYINRLQSEDRSHRLTGGGMGAVSYYDMVASRTVDEKILRSLRECADVANKITGDSYREWLAES